MKGEKTMEEKKFALLIDADNISSKYTKLIIDELSKYGAITYKRVYGDLTTPQNKSWKSAMLSHSINPVQHYAYTNGKNSTDAAMVIDAMDILYSGSVNGFCLVSSDSDFTKLAMRLRESGMTVIGMGESKTPEPFRVSCEKFILLDILSDESIEVESDKKSSEENAVTPIDDLEVLIAKIIMDNGIDGTYMDLGELGSRITKSDSSFDIRNYGFTKFSKFMEQFKSLKLENNGTAMVAHLLENKLPLSTIEADVINFLMAEEKHSMNTGSLSQKLFKLHPAFSPSNYGYSKFSKMLSEFKSVKVSGLGRIVTLTDKAIEAAESKAKKAPLLKKTNKK